MLRIYNINPTGLFSYRDSGFVSFEDGNIVNLIGINQDTGGGSNGAGKSSLFNSICELLFGENPTGVKGPGVVNNVWEKGCCARVEFSSWENVRYRVTLCRDWKESYYSEDCGVSYKGTGLFLDKHEGAVWKDVRGSGMPQTRDIVLQKIGISYNRFLSIAYMSNRVGNKFLRGTNKDRVDILSGITGVEEWDDILSKSRKKKSELDTEVGNINVSLMKDKGALEILEKRLEELNANDWKQMIESYRSSLKDNESSLEEIETNIKFVNGDIVKIEKHLEKANNQINEENEKVNKIDKELAVILNRRCEIVSDKDLQDKLAAAKRDMDFVSGRIASYGEDNSKLLDMDKCPTCGSKVTEAKKGKIKKKLEGLSDQLRNFKEEYDSINEDIEKDNQRVKDEFSKFELSKTEETSSLNSEIATYRKVVANGTAVCKELRDQIRGFQGKRVSLERDLVGIQRNIEEIPKYIKTCEENINSIDAVKKDIDARDAEINKKILNIASIEKDLRVVNWLISNIPYIKLHKLSVSMTVLSDFINNCLSEMGETIRVDIKAFSEKKSKRSVGDFTDLLKGEVDVEITDGKKNINSRLYSDGEMGKISNAFVRSLREMALKSGHGCNILMLDEVFSFIDYYNSQRLADSFVNNNLGTIVITDNSERAANLMNFDKTWIARKQTGLTTLEVS